MAAVLVFGLVVGAVAGARAGLDVPPNPQAVPNAGSTVPPPVNTIGCKGVSSEYARADHTHVSSVYKMIVTTDANGNATFNFPSGLFSSPPVISADIENPSPSLLYTRSVPVHTKDQVVIKVQNIALVGLIVTNAGNIGVNLFAAKQSDSNQPAC